ncbi:MAG: hypothetical protein ABIH50_07790 [bacterium]
MTSLVVSPSTVTVGINKLKYFSADGKTSVGTIVTVVPTWSVTGGIGTISSDGWFTASGTEGSGDVIATVGSIEGRATVTITANGWLAATITTPGGGLAQGIKVYLNNTSYSDFTDASGQCTLSDIPAGTYEVTTYDPGGIYLAISEEVTVASGETRAWTKTLSPINPSTSTTTTSLII